MTTRKSLNQERYDRVLHERNQSVLGALVYLMLIVPMVWLAMDGGIWVVALAVAAVCAFLSIRHLLTIRRKNQELQALRELAAITQSAMKDVNES